MKVLKNFKLIGIAMLIVVGLVACGKKGSTEAVTLNGAYSYDAEAGGAPIIEIYYSDGAYIQLIYAQPDPNNKPFVLAVTTGVCRVNGEQLDCRRTGSANVTNAIKNGRPDINQDDFEPINVETTDIIKMDTEGNFKAKRVKTVRDGQTLPVNDEWSKKYSRLHLDKQDELKVRNIIPVQFFQDQPQAKVNTNLAQPQATQTPRDGLASADAGRGIGTNTNKTFRDCPECPDMVEIPAGSFEMGTNNVITMYHRGDEELPVHQVTIGSAFAIGKTEVTQNQWKAIMGKPHSQEYADKWCTSGECPVESLSWEDAHIFIKKLNDKTGKRYRLPSEAEWEYACRAREQYKYCGSDNVKEVAWTRLDAIDNVPRQVATKRPNAWGLYDMSGNVAEWVEDDYIENYNGAPINGSAWVGRPHKDFRVVRGGDIVASPEDSCTACRSHDLPIGDYLSHKDGIRLVRTLP